jgi:hypothetical protein
MNLFVTLVLRSDGHLHPGVYEGFADLETTAEQTLAQGQDHLPTVQRGRSNFLSRIAIGCKLFSRR